MSFSSGAFPDHRGLEVCRHGDRPAVPVDLHPGVCGGNAGAVRAAAVPELQHTQRRGRRVGHAHAALTCTHAGTHTPDA